jgi:MPBQ/MSBQ methyltransferase
LRIPPYFDYLIEAFLKGAATRSVHLGYWESPPRMGTQLPESFWTPAEFAQAQRRLDARVIALGSFADGQRVLDAGCGLGSTLEALNAGCSGMRMCGINVDQRQLAVCRSLKPAPGNSLEWVEADACASPHPDASFDRVACVEAMFHFPSRRKFFSEAARLLAPGGALVGTDIVVAPTARELDTAEFPIACALDEGYGPWPDFWGADADHEKLAAAAGLRRASLTDATAQTLPSHHFTSPAGATIHAALQSADANAALRAALMLKWLHVEGHLRYLLFRFDKPLERT